MSALVERESLEPAQIRLRIGRLREREIVALIVVIGSVVSWLRLPAVTRSTLWAEDSRDFLSDALHQGALMPLFQSYAGYLQFVPRLIAGATVTFVPVGQWAHSMAAGSCLVVACVAAAVLVCSRDLVPSVPARVALASLTVLVPTSPHEVLGNTANLHWYFLWLAPWLLLHRPRNRVEALLLGLLGLAGALSEIQMAWFAPLVLWRWRDRSLMPVRVFTLVGIAAQVTTTLLLPRQIARALPNSWASTAYGYLINCAMTIWLPGSSAIGHFLVRFGVIGAIACLLPFVAAIVWVAVYGSRKQRSLVFLLGAASVVLWVIAVRTNPGTYYSYATETPSQLASPWISRYGVVPSLALLSVLVIALTVRAAPRAAVTSSVQRRARLTGVPWTAVVPRAVIAAVVITAIAVQFVPTSTRRSNGPEFAPQVASATRACASEPASTPVEFFSPPSSNWVIRTTCALITTAHDPVTAPLPARKASSRLSE
ncbi:MAG: hypothetical protein JWP75_2460 [Frondihabitans sp.]|nr:hypothetical protein [Frondihabitans sp.]